MYKIVSRSHCALQSMEKWGNTLRYMHMGLDLECSDSVQDCEQVTLCPTEYGEVGKHFAEGIMWCPQSRDWVETFPRERHSVSASVTAGLLDSFHH